MSQPLLIILSPPRSFSSVVSTMIGQHPELYGFPELHMFLGETVGEILDREQARGRNYAGPPGLLRALAQLHEGCQTTQGVLRAGVWLAERRDWSGGQLLDHLLTRVGGRIGVEKTPVTCLRQRWIERAYRAYPKARFLHLTRHPCSSKRSMRDYFHAEGRERRLGQFDFDYLLLWYFMHRNIFNFTATLPAGQSMLLRGEDLLAEPRCYLPQICRWLGVSEAPEAVERMLHPEESPYAHFGPVPARTANDPKFHQNPVLRPFKGDGARLQDCMPREAADWVRGDGLEQLDAHELTLLPPERIQAEVTGLAERMGYR